MGDSFDEDRADSAFDSDDEDLTRPNIQTSLPTGMEDSDEENDEPIYRSSKSAGGKRARGSDDDEEEQDEDDIDEEEDEDEEEGRRGRGYDDDEEDEEDDDDEDENTRDVDEDSEDDDDDDGDEDSGSRRMKSKKDSEGKKKKTQKTKKPKSAKREKMDLTEAQKRRSKMASRIFIDEAEHASDEDESEDIYEDVEEVLVEEEIMARERVARRHQTNQDMHKKDAVEIAQELEDRYRNDRRREHYIKGQMGMGNTMGLTPSSVAQQSLLPGISDPGIWQVKTKPGMEQQLVRSILLKSLESRRNGEPLKIKSCFTTASKGCIYIEALAEPMARESVQGLRGLYHMSFTKVPIGEMTKVLTVSMRKAPLDVGQWVVIKRGPLKGDVAKVIHLLEGGSKAVIQAVPRPDYRLIGKEGKVVAAGKGYTRPPQMLFSKEEANLVQRGAAFNKTFEPFGEVINFWNGEYYKDGFMLKEVNVSSYLSEEPAKPALELLRIFRNRKRDPIEKDLDNDDSSTVNDDESRADENTGLGAVMDDILDVMESSSEMNKGEKKLDKSHLFVVGELVQVMDGEFKGMVGRVVSVNEVSQLLKMALIPGQNVASNTEVEVEVALVVKYIKAGAHVKVIEGIEAGQTGTVVCLNAMDGGYVATVLTDLVNSQIMVNVSHLQVSREVNQGIAELKGYTMYDLVSLNQNEAAVITAVGPDYLMVVNHQGIAKKITPMDVKGKKNDYSNRTTAFDANHQTIRASDYVKVTEGIYKDKNGTIKHVFKSMVWLHHNNMFKNSGIFVVRCRSCLLVGHKGVGGNLSATVTPGLSGVGAKPTILNISNMTSRAKGNDSEIGKTVRITKGAFKGNLAQIIRSNATHFDVELLARLKKVNIERANTVMVGDENGSLDRSAGSNGFGGEGVIPSTPFAIAETPRQFAGSKTPQHTAETPQHTPSSVHNDFSSVGGTTPRSTHYGYDDFDPWKANQSDLPNSNISSGSSIRSDGRDNTSLGWDSSAGLSNRSGTGSDWGDWNDWGSTSKSGRSPAVSDTGSSWGERDSDRYSPLSNNSTPIHESVVGGSSGGRDSYYNSNDRDYSRGESRDRDRDRDRDRSNSRSYQKGPSSSSNAKTGSAISHSDWTAGTVVTLLDKGYIGKLAVIQQRATSDGMFNVREKERSDRVFGSVLKFHYTDLALAEPSKGSKIRVVFGSKAGSEGFLKTIVNNDVLYEPLSSGGSANAKLSNIVWILND